MSPRTRAPRDPIGRTGRRLIGVALIAMVVTFVTLGFLRVNPFSDRREVQVVFDDARGIAKAGTGTLTEVRLAGAKIGDVTDYEREGDDARFTIALDDEVGDDLRSDATATLRPRIPFEGTAYIDLSPGSPSAPALGDEIRPRRTRNYVGLYEALSFANPSVRAALRGTIRELGDVLEDEGRRGVRRTFDELPQVMRDLGPGLTALGGPRGRELAGVVSGTSRTFSAVARQERRLTPFLRGAEATFGAMDTDGGRALDATLRALPPTLRSIRAGSAALRATLGDLDPLAADLRPGLRALDPTLTAARPFLRRALPALTRATPLVGDLRTALRSAGSATPATRRLLDATRPTANILNASLLGALHRKTESGAPAYLALINTLAGGAGAFATMQTKAQGQTENALGFGHFVHFEGRFYTGYATPELPPCALLTALNPTLSSQLEQRGVCAP